MKVKVFILALKHEFQLFFFFSFYNVIIVLPQFFFVRSKFFCYFKNLSEFDINHHIFLKNFHHYIVLYDTLNEI